MPEHISPFWGTQGGCVVLSYVIEGTHCIHVEIGRFTFSCKEYKLNYVSDTPVAAKGGSTLVTLLRNVTPYRDSVDRTRDHVTYQKLVMRSCYGSVWCAVGIWPSHQRDDTVTAGASVDVQHDTSPLSAPLPFSLLMLLS